MIIRFRRFAALLALLALATSGVEQAWAAACGEMDGMPAASAGMSAADTMAGMHAADGDADHDASVPGERRSHPAPESATCPIAAASGMGCGIAALPIITASALEPHGARTALPRAADQAPGFLALSSLFRPPRP